MKTLSAIAFVVVLAAAANTPVSAHYSFIGAGSNEAIQNAYYYLGGPCPATCGVAVAAPTCGVAVAEPACGCAPVETTCCYGEDRGLLGLGGFLGVL